MIYDEPLAANYIDVLCRQIKGLEGQFSTIYIGGGTPTVLGEDLLSKLLKNLKRLICEDIEFTIEANPESLNEKSIDIMLKAGVNRLSIGVQSFNDDTLRKLGRVHNGKTAYEAVAKAEKGGFKNISIDLIFGAWEEKLPDWKKELREAVSLPVKHISVYSLTYEKNTALSKMLKNGLIKPLEDEAVARMYEYSVDFLEERGFSRYEVSNFAKKGFFCEHNLNYWQNNSYIGSGPSAVSYLEGVRKKNISDIQEYIARIKKGNSVIKFKEKLSAVQKAKETAALKIRTKEGINLEWFNEKTGFNFLGLEKAAITSLEEKELIDYEQKDGKIKRVSLTKNGFLFCDTVSSELL